MASPSPLSPVDGMLRQYIALPASSMVKIPKTTTLSWAQLASLVCTGTTAWNALYGNIPLKPGQTVLFQGTGGVSMTGLMLAKAAAAGAITIITSSSDDKLKMAWEKYDADHCINYMTIPNWAEEANKITDGRGVDFVIENGGSGFLSPAKDMPDVASMVLGKGCIVRGINVGAKQLTEDLVRLVCGKDLQMPAEKTFRFTREGVIEAYKYLESGSHVGKICIQIV